MLSLDVLMFPVIGTFEVFSETWVITVFIQPRRWAEYQRLGTTNRSMPSCLESGDSR